MFCQGKKWSKIIRYEERKTLSTIKQCILSSRPGIGNSCKPTNFKLTNINEPPFKELNDGEIYCETIFLSVDPYMRCMLDENHPQLGEYLEPQALGQVCSGGGIGKVLKSNHPDFKEDMYICVPFLGYPWSTNAILQANDPNLDVQRCALDSRPSLSLGLLGMPGLTSYFCMLNDGNPKENETVVISGAGGMCGSVAAQLAKRRGANVVAISGSKEKNHILETYLNVDKTICYKDIDYEEQLITACRDMGGVDVYMDNVGGTLSDVILKEINHNARIPICGQIANYDENISYMDMISNEKGISLEIQEILKDKNAIRKRFLVLDYIEQWPDALEELRNLVVNKELKTVETIDVGFNPGKAFTDMMNGENLGKAIVDIHGSILLNDNDATTYFEKRNDNKYWIVN